MTETCETCYWWAADGSSASATGEASCRLRGPHEPDEYGHRFPQMYRTEGCGDHKLDVERLLSKDVNEALREQERARLSPEQIKCDCKGKVGEPHADGCNSIQYNRCRWCETVGCVKEYGHDPQRGHLDRHGVWPS